MTRRRSNGRFFGRSDGTRAAVGVAVLLGATGTAFGQARTLEGVWGVVTQDRNCATNAAQGPPTRALITYHAGGTLSESRYIPVFAIGQLSACHGTWSHDGGLTYTGRVVTMIQFDTAAEHAARITGVSGGLDDRDPDHHPVRAGQFYDDGLHPVRQWQPRGLPDGVRLARRRAVQVGNALKSGAELGDG